MFALATAFLSICACLESAQKFPAFRDGQKSNHAFVTLATNDEYSIAALVMGETLRSQGTKKDLVVLTTTQISAATRMALRRVFDQVINVDQINSDDNKNLEVLDRRELGVTFSKFHCFNLVDYKKCVFVDADTIILKNIDDLFDYEDFSAAPDLGWPDCFNSGVFVFNPSKKRYDDILKFAEDRGSFDGGDQGLLNTVHNDWRNIPQKRIPILYNCPAHIGLVDQAAFNSEKDKIKVIHFLAKAKPWKGMEDVSPQDPRYEYREIWWKALTEKVMNDFKGTDVSALNHLQPKAPGVWNELNKAIGAQ